jgi:hypothetical protein
LSAGTFQLYIFPGTTCDWRFEILALGAAPVAPAIQLESVASYIVNGNEFTPTKVERMGQTLQLVAFYSTSGNLPGPVTARVVIHESGTGPTQTFGLKRASNLTNAFVIDLVFAPKYGAVVGPASARFTITSGSVYASSTLHFKLAA